MKITQQLLEEMVKDQLNEATLKDWLIGLAAVGTASKRCSWWRRTIRQDNRRCCRKWRS